MSANTKENKRQAGASAVGDQEAAKKKMKDQRNSVYMVYFTIDKKGQNAWMTDHFDHDQHCAYLMGVYTSKKLAIDHAAFLRMTNAEDEDEEDSEDDHVDNYYGTPTSSRSERRRVEVVEAPIDTKKTANFNRTDAHWVYSHRTNLAKPAPETPP